MGAAVVGNSLLSGRGPRSARSGRRPAYGSERAEGRLHRVAEGAETPGPRSRPRACRLRGLRRGLGRAGFRLRRTTAASHPRTAARAGRTAPSAPRRALAASASWPWPQAPLIGHGGSPPRDALPHLVRTPQPDELSVRERRPHERQARIGPGGRVERGPEQVEDVPHQLRAEHAVRRRGLIPNGTDIGGQVVGRQAPLPLVGLPLLVAEVVRRPARRKGGRKYK